MERNRVEIAKEKEALIEAQQQVADFKKSLFDMYRATWSSFPLCLRTFEEASGAEPRLPRRCSSRYSKSWNKAVYRREDRCGL